MRHAVHGRHHGLLHQLAVHVRRERDGERLRLRIFRVFCILRHDPLEDVGDARVDVTGSIAGHQVDLLAASLVTSERRVVLQAVAAAVLVDGESAHVRGRVAGGSSSFNLEATRQALPRVLGVEPETPVGAQRVPRRLLQQVNAVLDPLTPLVHGQFVHAPRVEVRGLYV